LLANLRGGGGGRGGDLLGEPLARLVEGGLPPPLQGQVELVERHNVRPRVRVGVRVGVTVRVRARDRDRIIQP